MKKVGLVTFYNNNYGSILQCLATKTVIESCSYECVIIDSDRKLSLKTGVQNKFKFVFKSIAHPSYLLDKLKMKKVYRLENNLLSEGTRSAMFDFVQNVFHPLLLSESEMNELGNKCEYKYFIVGSDQVWNLSRDVEDFYFLSFAKKEKRIVFAPSFGVGSIPSFNKSYLKKLHNFNRLSFREELACNIAKEVFSGPIELIGDPATMLTKEEWINLAGSIKKYKSPDRYVLVHFLNEPGEIAIDNINSICLDKSCVAVCLGYKHNSFNSLNNYIYMDGDPFVFLHLMESCYCVFTDSFHSILFSIIFSKNFFCYKRQYLHDHSQESRVTDLLSRLSLMDRFIERDEQFKKAKSMVSCNLVTGIRQKTKEYLIRSLTNE